MSVDYGMDDLRIDFTNVEDQKEFTPVPPSKQLVTITDWDKGEVTGEQSKNKGATKLTFEFTLQEGEYANRKIWDTFTIVENSLWKLKAFLGAIGEDVTGALSLEPEEYVGRELVIKLGVQPKRRGPDGTEYEARNNVKGYYPTTDAIEGGSGSSNLMP